MVMMAKSAFAMVTDEMIATCTKQLTATSSIAPMATLLHPLYRCYELEM
jgi:hypothetical protein